MALTNARVEYRVDATVNLGNFENVKPGITLSADVPEGENPKDVINELSALGDAFITHQVNEAKSG